MDSHDTETDAESRDGLEERLRRAESTDDPLPKPGLTAPMDEVSEEDGGTGPPHRHVPRVPPPAGPVQLTDSGPRSRAILTLNHLD
jgi:hypothetical protein